MLHDMRRLHPRGAANQGLCVDAEGAMLGAEWVLVHRTLKGFRALERDDATALQKSILSEGKDHGWLFRQCGRIADALNRGDIALAQIYGLHIPIARFDQRDLARIAKTGFDPDEPRIPKGDPHGGEWTTGLDGGGGGLASPETAMLDTATTTDAASQDSGGGEDTGDGTPDSGEDAGTPPFDFQMVSPDGPGEASSAGAPENTSAPAISDSLPDVPQPGQGTQLVPGLMAYVGSEADWLATLTPAAASALRQMLLGMGGASFTFGFLFIPTNRSPIVEGPITNSPTLSYRFDGDMGILQLRQVTGSLGPVVVSEGHVGTDGLFRDAQGHVIGRYLPGSGVIIDAGALPGYRMLPDGTAAPASSNDRANEPKLCPDPSPDRPGAPKDNAYQQYISILVNNRALPPGLAVSLFNPFSGKDVVFDDCRLTDGTMIEAKGERYAYLLRYAAPAESIESEFLDRAERQLQAAGSRLVEWYFAERDAADFARALFEKNRIPITVIYEPWPKSIH